MPAPKPSQPQRRPTPLRARGNFYQEHVHGRERLLGIGILGAMALLYWLGVLGEDLAAALLAAVVILGGALYGIAKLLEGGQSRALIAGLGLLTLPVAALPAAQTLFPGTPAAHGELRKVGDTMPVPEAARGTVRVLLHGKLAGQGASEADVVLDLGGHGNLHGQLSRTLNRTRVGRRGSGISVHEHNSEYLTAEVPADTKQVALGHLGGALAGPLEVSIFPERVPLPVEIALAALLVLVFSALAARMHVASSAVGGIACALLFGILVSRMATPDEAVGPEVGAFFVSVLGAACIAGISVWLLSQVIARRA